jgi:hypothetical protein
MQQENAKQLENIQAALQTCRVSKHTPLYYACRSYVGNATVFSDIMSIIFYHDDSLVVMVITIIAIMIVLNGVR